MLIFNKGNEELTDNFMKIFKDVFHCSKLR